MGGRSSSCLLRRSGSFLRGHFSDLITGKDSAASEFSIDGSNVMTKTRCFGEMGGRVCKGQLIGEERARTAGLRFVHIRNPGLQ